MNPIRFRALRVNPNVIDYNGALAESEVYVKTFLEGLVEKVRPYPPSPAGSRYERTGQLWMGWRVKLSPHLHTYRMQNSRYEPIGAS